MNFGSGICGLVFGAAVGVLTTEASLSDRRDETERAFRKERWLIFRNATSRSLLPRILWAMMHLLRIEAILLLTFGLLLSSALLWISVSTAAAADLLLGAMIGFAAAPWVWLHFSKDLHDVTDDSGPNALSRYKFMTVVLAVLVATAISVPYLPDLFGRIHNVQLGFASVDLFARPTSLTTAVYSLAGKPQSGNGSANDQLSSNTDLAQRIAGVDTDPHVTPRLAGLPVDSQLAAIKPDLQGFDALSVIDRDRAFIAFLATNSQSKLPAGNDLRSYIDQAQEILPRSDEVEIDLRFARAVSPLFTCLGTYAKTLSDYHLFLIDASPTIKAYLEAINHPGAEAGDGPETPIAPVPNDSSLSASTPGSRVVPRNARDRLQSEARTLMSNIRDALRYLSGRPAGAPGAATCETVINLTGLPNQPPPTVTPYPLLIGAYTLAAVDSAETGVVLVSNWLRATKGNIEPGRDDDIRRGWYRARAMLNLGQIASGSRDVPAPKSAIVRFQRATTDQMAAVLGVSTPIFWTRFCDMLRPNTLHSGLGRRLAFAYATARNTLFELLEPDFLSFLRDSDDRIERVRAPVEELEEAKAILDSAPRCFEGVPFFEQNRPQLMGEFRLNAAQLRVDILATISNAERGSELQAIQRELDGAERQLGVAKSSASTTAVDLLLKSDPFQPDRDRLHRLRNALDAIAAKL